MSWNHKEFAIPRLYSALQTENEFQFEKASDDWENSSHNYKEYLASVDFPDWLREFVFGKQETGINSSDKLHDALVKEFWSVGKKLVIVYSTRNCAWDARQSVVVVEYELDSPHVILDGKVEEMVFLYDQFSDMGNGVYRHYIMFNKCDIQIDFTYLKVSRFILSE